MKHAQWRIKEDTNIAWGNALDCPLFKKPRIPGKDPKTGKPKPLKPDAKSGVVRLTRPNRALGSHTVKALLSGAAAAVAAQQHYDAKLLRCDIGTKGKNEDKTETNTYPMLGTIAPGALMLYDQAFVAFKQEAYSTPGTSGTRSRSTALRAAARRRAWHFTMAMASTASCQRTSPAGSIPRRSARSASRARRSRRRPIPPPRTRATLHVLCVCVCV